ncbi:membrane protein [Weissella viridescens]|uniref:DUF1361 domain-containing protein n=2 Tax=Weissella viridescens TaxID=1629 RepID=A0A0R2H6Q9_WEIVI|nr:DUF1361 domain-containing protein [Weissella viridescens]KRN46229.1 hypothetical protein IV50_GL001215 [Weissella viridescens]GEA95417.1 membrane protein [Weissella viridescens]
MQADIKNQKLARIVVLHVILIALMLVITQLPTPSRFLIWNLFLAVIPFDLAWLYIYLKPQAGSKWILLGVALVWLLFYPNTLYMLTDYIHLQAVGVDLTGIYQVLNYVILTAGIFLGAFFGFESAYQMRYALIKNPGWWISVVYYGGLSAISAFGIYLGRYLRLNSWHVLTEPIRVVEALNHALVTDHGFTLKFLILFTCLEMMLFGVYAMLKKL